ncbi:MAG: hypothetical protein ABI896_06305 [Actinomycetota bacterium]
MKAVVLWVVGIFILTGPGHLNNNSGDSPEKILSQYVNHSAAIQWGAWLVVLGALAFLWFVSSLRSVLFSAEGGNGRIATIATIGGIATGICVILAHLPSFAAASTSDNLTPDAAKALVLMDDTFYYAAEYSLVLLFFGTALVIYREGVLPVWLMWVSVVFGVLALIPPIGWAVLAIGLPLWTLATSWLLFAAAGADPEAAEPDAPAPMV